MSLKDIIELICEIPPWLLHTTVVAMFLSIVFLNNSLIFIAAFMLILMVDLLNISMRNMK